MTDYTQDPQNPQEQQQQQGPTVIVNQAEKKSNGLGTAGFIMALLAGILFWVPVLNWILWILGLVFSFIGVFKKPRGLAIAGLIISLLWIIVIVVVVGAIMAGAAGALSNF